MAMPCSPCFAFIVRAMRINERIARGAYVLYANCLTALSWNESRVVPE